MNKVFEIKCDWLIDEETNKKGSWQGRIILNEDGWFEGIVNDIESKYTDDRFIFGVFIQDKIIELHLLARKEISEPFVYYGTKNNNSYSGNFESSGLFGPYPTGISNINTYETDLSYSSYVETKINNFKDSIMDTEGKNYYSKILNNKDELFQSVLNKYEGKELNKRSFKNLVKIIRKK